MKRSFSRVAIVNRGEAALRLRPHLIEAVEKGIAKELERVGALTVRPTSTS